MILLIHIFIQGKVGLNLLITIIILDSLQQLILTMILAVIKLHTVIMLAALLIFQTCTGQISHSSIIHLHLVQEEQEADLLLLIPLAGRTILIFILIIVNGGYFSLLASLLMVKITMESISLPLLN